MIPKVNKRQKLFNYLWNWNDKKTNRVKAAISLFIIVLFDIHPIKRDGTTAREWAKVPY